MKLLNSLLARWRVEDPLTQPCPDCWAEVGEPCLAIGVSTDHLPEEQRYMSATHRARSWKQ